LPTIQKGFILSREKKEVPLGEEMTKPFRANTIQGRKLKTHCENVLKIW